MTESTMEKAVILARGLGTRMRRPNEGVRLDPSQEAAADTGVKAMVPVGRPFLDYILSALADVGYRQACLVIGPEHDAVRHYYEVLSPPQRIRVTFAVQAQPLGTADAVLAAEGFAAGDSSLVINSDNFYPASALAALRLLGEPGVVLFEREGMLRESNISPERMSAFAHCFVDRDGYLESIVEKPDAQTVRAAEGASLISMNCWRFSPSIFRACRGVSKSPRGELELPRAVMDAITRFGERFRVVRCREGVLDLSTRADIQSVAERLRGVEARP